MSLRNNKWLLSGLLPLVVTRPHWNCSAVSFSWRMWPRVYKRCAYTCCHYFSYLASPCTVHPYRPPLGRHRSARSAFQLLFLPSLHRVVPCTILEIPATRTNKLHPLNSTREPAPEKIKRFLWQTQDLLLGSILPGKRVSYIPIYWA